MPCKYVHCYCKLTVISDSFVNAYFTLQLVDTLNWRVENEIDNILSVSLCVADPYILHYYYDPFY